MLTGNMDYCLLTTCTADWPLAVTLIYLYEIFKIFHLSCMNASLLAHLRYDNVYYFVRLIIVDIRTLNDHVTCRRRLSLSYIAFIILAIVKRTGSRMLMEAIEEDCNLEGDQFTCSRWGVRKMASLPLWVLYSF